MNRSKNIFRTILVLVGAISALVSLNVALGGFETLGWQGPTNHFRVTDADAFAIRDSHARFYGGVYAGIAAPDRRLPRHRQVPAGTDLVFGLIFLGGLARISQGDLDVIFGPTCWSPLSSSLWECP